MKTSSFFSVTQRLLQVKFDENATLKIFKKLLHHESKSFRSKKLSQVLKIV